MIDKDYNINILDFGYSAEIRDENKEVDIQMEKEQKNMFVLRCWKEKNFLVLKLIYSV